jgi:phytoene dehydrogenase-like protein
MHEYDVIIVGGGHNGLITAGYLAKAGLKTIVLERRSIVGGACVTEDIANAPGYRVSTGAAQLGNLRPEIVADLDLASFGYELLLPDPLSVFLFPDGRYLPIWLDSERTFQEIQTFSGSDANAYRIFYQDCIAFCDLIEPLLYAEETPTLGGIQEKFQAAGRTDLFRDFLLGSAWDLLRGRFESDAIRAVAGFTATFGTNAGPKSPGTAYVMAHHMFGGVAGVRGRTGYVKGGMGGLANALANAASHYGATIWTDAEVSQVTLTGEGRARGVELADGRSIKAAHIVSNADPQRTFLGLVEREAITPGFAEAVGKIEMQGVALKVNCALERLPRFAALPPEMVPARVTLCPSLDYVETAWDQAKRGYPSSKPFMTVHMQSAIDSSLAPDGRHTLTCYAQYFPYNLDQSFGGWEAARDAAGKIVLETVAAYAPDLYDVISEVEVMTPLDIERRFAMTGGHQFHGDLSIKNLFDGRPASGCLGARTPIEGLYLCGAGAHPGGCVWGAPGQQAARAVLIDLKNPIAAPFSSVTSTWP